MKKRLQIVLNEEAWSSIETLTNEANAGFDNGSINYSDAINEMVLTSKVDIKALQLKHTDWRRSLKSFASNENADIDSVIKCLAELKSKLPRASAKAVKPSREDAAHAG